MNDQPRQVLHDIIQTYGESICDEPSRCEGLLRDMCGEYKREVLLLVNALKQGIAVDLRSRQETISMQIVLPKLVRRLEDNLALTTEAATWAVESWAVALTGSADMKAGGGDREQHESQTPQVLYRKHVKAVLQSGGNLQLVKTQLEEYQRQLGLTPDQARAIESRCMEEFTGEQDSASDIEQSGPTQLTPEDKFSQLLEKYEQEIHRYQDRG